MRVVNVNDGDWEQLALYASIGNQRKWYNKKTNEFCKEQNKTPIVWKDYLVEVLSTRICCQINMPYRFAKYEVCSISDNQNKSMGCISKNFLENRESILTLYHFMESHDIEFEYGKDTQAKYAKLSNIFLEATGDPCHEYLAVLFLVDYLIGNTDRHLRNFAMVRSASTGKLTPAPLFDFGAGLFQCNTSIYDYQLRRKMTAMRYKPFDTRFDTALKTYRSMGYINDFIPSSIDVSGIEFPDNEGKILLALHCKELGIRLEGVERFNVQHYW